MGTASAPTLQTAHPRASQPARQLLQLLRWISGRRTLSGQHHFIRSGNRYALAIRELTGKTPAVWGSDFSFALRGENPRLTQHCGPLNLTEPGTPAAFLEISPEQARHQLIEEIKARHAEGHIITLMWHHPFPPCGDTGRHEDLWTMSNRPSPQVWQELTAPGTALFEAWSAQVEGIVPWLRELHRAGIPVLWRPYHEMNGVWFWWCRQAGPHGFVRLWQQLFNRLAIEHDLDNLLWVWNANAPRDKPGDEAYPYVDYFPDPATVDVLAADVYHNDYRLSHHEELAQLAGGRPLALGETGEIPTPATLANQPRWSWFMPWGNLVLARNTPESIRDLYSSPRVASLEDLPGLWREAAGEAAAR